ncbi:hypothetical protein GP486_005378 [Trichoglossum hirsutum]|uniref:Rhodopsin domain-containing protein n=1 Tax=Trichoglossum hirsutum TaxID=265104 RepID=A0A9P8L989_9PEZI|nr:hypothetical protein GP486_005378 [Trichoglossum hirsutum]
MIIIILRVFARVRWLGVAKLHADDWLMINAGLWYTLLCVSLNQIASGGGSNLMSREEIDALTPVTIAERIRGSKWVFVSEQAMLIAIWSMKCCMLVIYSRLTVGLKQRDVIVYLAYYVAAGFVGCELAMFLSCQPFHGYWSVPAREAQCSTYQHYGIAQLCFNISSDLIMLLVALPLLFSAQLRSKQKVIVCVIFGMGVFIIAAAIITKVYRLVPKLLSLVYIFWYFREATVAVYVTNIPLLWSLLLDVSPALRDWVGRTGSTIAGCSGCGDNSVGLESGYGHAHSSSTRGGGKEYPHPSVNRIVGNGSSSSTGDGYDDDYSCECSQSQERINRRRDSDGVSDTNTTMVETPHQLVISKEVSFYIEEGPSRTSLCSVSEPVNANAMRFDMVSQGGNRYTTRVQGGGGVWA